MREHEVPTHVQAEDRVLLWFTFPQVVAIVAVCALSYGAYRYAPVGPSEVRMAIAVLLGLAGVAAVVGKIGGRRLPLVAADLLKYRLGARLYEGPPSQLVRSEPPAPVHPVHPVKPVRSGPGPLRMMARGVRERPCADFAPGARAGSGRADGCPSVPTAGSASPGRTEADKDTINGNGNGADSRKDKRRKLPKGFLPVVAAVAMAAAVATVPQAALADGHEDGGWSSDEIEFQPPQLVEGRRIFIERLSVTGDRAAVTLRAATTLDIRVRAFGGPQGTLPALLGFRVPGRGGAHRLLAPPARTGPVPSPSRGRTRWDRPGPSPSSTAQIPHPLPAIEGELCDLRE